MQRPRKGAGMPDRSTQLYTQDAILDILRDSVSQGDRAGLTELFESSQPVDIASAANSLEDEELQSFLADFEHFMAGEVCGQKKLIRNLSAGNKQKLGIVAAMLLHPQILILDEPFNFLDPSSQSAIKHLLTKYNQETGATILVSSHNLQHTVDICPRIALLENGVIIRDIANHNGEAIAELENYFEV